MSRAPQPILAVVLAALLGGLLSGCTCMTPATAAAPHGCCESDGGAVLAAAHTCCTPDSASRAGIVVIPANEAGPAASVAGFPPLAVTAACAPASSVPVPASAHPLVLRI
jgi:hypothetical protein